MPCCHWHSHEFRPHCQCYSLQCLLLWRQNLKRCITAETLPKKSQYSEALSLQSLFPGTLERRKCFRVLCRNIDNCRIAWVTILLAVISSTIGSLWKKVCVHICVHVCVCTCVYICVCVYMCVHVCAYMCVHVCAYMCIHVCIHVYTHLNMCICMCVYLCIYMCIYVPAYIRVCVYICEYTCVYIYIYLCMHVYV